MFDRSGCVRVPGQELIPERARVRSYPVVEKDEIISIWMGEAAKADPSGIIDYPWHNDHKAWPHRHDVYHIGANYMLMVDNLIDLTHLGYVRAKTIGGNPMTHVEAKMKTTRTPKGLKYLPDAELGAAADRCQGGGLQRPRRPLAGIRIHRSRQHHPMDRRGRCRHRRL